MSEEKKQRLKDFVIPYKWLGYLGVALLVVGYLTVPDTVIFLFKMLIVGGGLFAGFFGLVWVISKVINK